VRVRLIAVMRSRAGALALCGAALTVALGACGSSSSSGRPQDPLITYYANKTRPAVMCTTFSRRFLAFYGGASECPRRIVPSKVVPQPTIAIRDVKTTAGHAEVTYQLTPGGLGLAVLVRESGHWKLDAMRSAPE